MIGNINAINFDDLKDVDLERWGKNYLAPSLLLIPVLTPPLVHDTITSVKHLHQPLLALTYWRLSRTISTTHIAGDNLRVMECDLPQEFQLGSVTLPSLFPNNGLLPKTYIKCKHNPNVKGLIWKINYQPQKMVKQTPGNLLPHAKMMRSRWVFVLSSPFMALIFIFQLIRVSSTRMHQPPISLNRSKRRPPSLP